MSACPHRGPEPLRIIYPSALDSPEKNYFHHVLYVGCEGKCPTCKEKINDFYAQFTDKDKRLRTQQELTFCLSQGFS